MNPRIRLLAAALLLFTCVQCSNSSSNASAIQMSSMTAPTLTISSPVFGHMDFIPKAYTCDGANINPPLNIAGIPEQAKTLALIVDDPDAPRGTWDHWIVWNIPLRSTIDENSVPGTVGRNDFGKNNYGGPCPPSGVHRYFFKAYALEIKLDLPSGADKSALEAAMKGHILAQGTLIGRYQRP